MRIEQSGRTVGRRWLAGVMLLFAGLPLHGHAADRLMFWNLTGATVTDLRLAPVGTQNWGANQCANDPDNAVDVDERLKLTGIAPGRYDVKLTQKSGRTCVVRNVEVKAGGRYAFSISEQDLQDCGR